MTISSILGLKKEILEDLAIAEGLIGVQFVYAGNSVLLSYLMSIGLNSLTIVIFSTFSTFLIISPFAFYFEREKWPKRLNFKLVTQLVLISSSNNSHAKPCSWLYFHHCLDTKAKTLGDFPAPMSLCAITSLIGVLITTIVQLLQDQTWDVFFPLVKKLDKICQKKMD
ncbi:hypothetical protein LINPERPRIM_LOCUS24234 [Linum perenne]